jgi:release factor glutamine methyltransferase
VDMRGGNVADGPELKALLAEAAALGVARLDAELLVARAAAVSRGMLLAHDELRLPRERLPSLRAELARRAAGEPLAYIEGRREFWSLDLTVTPDVLVPRPETELLVEAALERLPSTAQQVADLGTGSGAVALALAHERPRWQVTATDASQAALAVAASNASRLRLPIEFLAGYWCDALGGRVLDAIVSNPPYVAADDAALPALSHEPRSALVAQDQGFADLLAIIRQAPMHLRPGGWLLLEHGATQAPRLGAALVTRGFSRVVSLPDLAGRDRVTCAQWPPSSP